MDVPFLGKLTGRQVTQSLEPYYKELRQTELISSTRTFSTNASYESGVRAGRASFFPVLRMEQREWTGRNLGLRMSFGRLRSLRFCIFRETWLPYFD